MGIGVSIFLMATGAIVAWALEFPDNDTINLDATGVILMVLGLVSLLASLLWWDDVFGDRRRSRRIDLDDEDVVVRRRVVTGDGTPLGVGPLVERRVVDDAGIETIETVRRPTRTVVREEVVRRDSF
ncbi:MAG: hypothetical protein ACRDY7_16910 [Acidimicrobiia bacterium]